MKRQDKSGRPDLLISGSFGPAVVVQSSGTTAINIAGGEGSGDVYQEVASRGVMSFDDVRKSLGEQALPPEQKTQINAALMKIEAEVGKGSDANIGFIEISLWSILEVSPRLLQVLARAILERTSNTAIRSLAQDFLNRGVRSAPR